MPTDPTKEAEERLRAWADPWATGDPYEEQYDITHPLEHTAIENVRRALRHDVARVVAELAVERRKHQARCVQVETLQHEQDQINVALGSHRLTNYDRLNAIAELRRKREEAERDLSDSEDINARLTERLEQFAAYGMETVEDALKQIEEAEREARVLRRLEDRASDLARSDAEHGIRAQFSPGNFVHWVAEARAAEGGEGVSLNICYDCAQLSSGACPKHASMPATDALQLTTEGRLMLFAEQGISANKYAAYGWDLAGDIAVLLARMESCRDAFKDATGEEFD